jgi:rhomboid protease GluP
MCPECRALITTSDRTCPYCHATVGTRAADRRNPGEILGGLIPQARFTTIMILIVNTALYVATCLYSSHISATPENDALFAFGAKIPFKYLLATGQWWRLVTAGFLHGSLMHILMNSWVLFDLGAEVETIFGTSRLIVFYFVSTVTGFLASALWYPGISIGASAGIFGLIGAMIAFGLTDRSSLGSMVKGLYVRWAIYGLVLGLLPFFRTDMAAHIGGLAGGFVCGLVLRTPLARAMWKEPLIRAAAGICIGLTVISFAMMFLAFRRGPA